MPTSSTNYYPALTGIRAIAAWMVFLHHFNFITPDIFGASLHAFFNEFHIGVTLFFVLSGLLITLRYIDTNLLIKQNLATYFLNRFARIYPAYFIILTINFIWLITVHVPLPNVAELTKAYVGSIFLIQGFFVHFSAELLPQSWSLTVEECFYASCPIIFMLIKKRNIIIISLPITLIAFGILITLLFANINFYGFMGNFRFLFNFTFFGRCIEFFVGIGLAILYKRYYDSIKKQAWFTIIGLVLIGLYTSILASLSTPTTLGDYHPFGIFVNNLLLPCTGIACLFWGLLTEYNWITQLLATPIMVRLGKASYIFYLIHLGFFMQVFVSEVSGHPLIVFLYLNMVALLFYSLVEYPLHKWLKSKIA